MFHVILYFQSDFGKVKQKFNDDLSTHIFEYNEICNCLNGLFVVLNGIPDGG